LLTLRPALLAIADQPILHPRAFEGLLDTMGNLSQAVPPHAGAPLQQTLAHLTQSLQATCSARQSTLAASSHWLVSTEALCGAMLLLLEADAIAAADAPLRYWAQTLLAQCRALQADLLWLQPLPDDLAADAGGGIPTLRALANAGSAPAQERMAQMDLLAQQAEAMARADYSFLYDTTRHLIAVGYNVDEHQRGAPVQLCGDCPGRGAAGQLVCVGTLADHSRQRHGPAVLEWLDV
jgi:hypothetical protein